MAKIIYINKKEKNIKKKIEPAVNAIRKGELVIFPTETVYGIAARADLPTAIDKIYIAKGRNKNKPFAYHVGSMDMIYKIAGKLSGNISRTLNKYLPGPFTFLLKTSNGKIGVRFPTCEIAQLFLKQCDCPIMATSANVSGKPSPININMTKEIKNYVAFIIDAGKTENAGDSTVVDLTVNPPEIIRQGSGKWENLV